MWILLIVFPFCTFSVVLDSREECLAAGQANVGYWASTGQQAKAVCMRTVEV